MKTKKVNNTLIAMIGTKTRAKNAGPRANNRFSFQEAWSLERILVEHAALLDYLALFDYCEDFVLFEDCEMYKTAKFFQIKTREKMPWKSTYWTERKRGSQSILEKLAANLDLFPDAKLSLFLVLNGQVDIEMKSGLSVPFKFTSDEIAKNELQIIKKKLAMSSKKFSSFSKCTTFLLTTLSLDDLEREMILKGKLTDFIAAIFPERSYKIAPIFDCLKAEIQRRSKYEREVASQEELIAKKGITKDQFSKFIEIGVDRTEYDIEKEIEDRLFRENISLRDIRLICDGLNELAVIRTLGSSSMESLLNRIDAIIEIEEKKQSKLYDLINAVYSELSNEDESEAYPEFQLKAMVAYAYQTKRKFQSSGQKSSQGNT